MRVILLLPLALAACTSSDESNQSVSGNEAAGIENAAQQPALPDQLSSTFDDDYFVTTNEPFISARTDTDARTILLSAAGEEDRRMRVVSSTPTPDGQRFIARDGRGDVVVTISGAACEDDMSGARYPLTGEIAIEGRRAARGCARPASAPPPPVPGEAGGRPSVAPSDASIPPRFHGEWQPNRAACRTPNASIEGLRIAARELRFHESLGVPVNVERTGPDRLSVTSDYEGEATQWTATQALVLSEGGERLTVTTRGERFSRIRCG